MNQCGRRGPHFEAILREHASILVKRPSGCRLLQGPFAVPPTVALAKVLSAWGARLTWTAQREYATQIIRAVETHKAASDFLETSVAPRVSGLGVGFGQGSPRAIDSGGRDGICGVVGQDHAG